MNSRVLKFNDNELFDFIWQAVAGYKAEGRQEEMTALGAFQKLSAVAVQTGHKVGRLVLMTLDPNGGPKQVVLLESERDLAKLATERVTVNVFDLPTKEAALAMLTNARLEDEALPGQR